MYCDAVLIFPRPHSVAFQLTLSHVLWRHFLYKVIVGYNFQLTLSHVLWRYQRQKRYSWKCLSFFQLALSHVLWLCFFFIELAKNISFNSRCHMYCDYPFSQLTLSHVLWLVMISTAHFLTVLSTHAVTCTVTYQSYYRAIIVGFQLTLSHVLWHKTNQMRSP